MLEMLPRPASHGSRLCIGILLVCVTTSLVKSQMSASFDLSKPSTISGNSRVLNRISQEEDSITPSTSSNGERKLAFQSPMTRSTKPSEWLENTSDITSELYSNNKKRHVLNNRDLLETTSAYHSQATPVTSSSIIDLEESTGPHGVTKKHVMEELIGESYSIIKENQNVKIPEFNEHVDYSDIEDNDKLGNREPTTTKKPRGHDGMVSLMNDTNVNYKAVKAKEHVEDDAMITMNLKITQENATNVISGESNIHVKSKVPKSTQVEIMKNVTTGPKPMRITEFDEFGKKLYKNMSSKAITPMSSSIIPDILNKNNEGIIKNNESDANNYEKSERNSLPKGRTISFSGINQFSNTEVKAVGSTQEANSEVEFTEEIKPYPYLKSSTINSLNSSKQLGDSSIEELSALENTIGKSPDIKKLVITESSAVIDNSILQIKPNDFKRSGNLSRMSNFNATSLLSSVTLRPRELIEETNSSTTQSIISDKTVNIIPMNHDGVIEKKSNLDLSSNGLTESAENNKTILNDSRATETNLVQNSTEIVESSDEAIETATNRDIQTNAEDSMLLVSSLNVTEDSTKIPTTIKSNVNESASSTTTFIGSLTSTIVTDKIFDDDTTTTTITTADIPQTTSNPVTISSITSQSLLPSPTTKTKSTNFSGRVLIENDSTTSSGVEYEFIGLTESTVSPSYISNSDTTSKTLTTDVTEFTSNLSDISTTFSSTDSSTASSKIQDLSSEINNDNSTISTTIKPDDSMTTYSSMPDEFVSTTENSLDTTIYTTSEYTDMPYPDETTIIQEETTYPEYKISNESQSNTSSLIDSFSPTILLTTTTTTMRTEMTTSNITNVTSPSGPSNIATITPGIEIIPVTLSTGNSTSVINTESPTANIVTNVQPFTPENVNLLVRIVVEDTWNDICANLSDLRQSLADLLTAGIEKTVLAIQIIFQKNPCMEKLQENIASPELTLSTLYLYVVNQNGNFDAPMTRILPSLYSSASIKSQLTIRSIQLVQDSDSGNAIAVVVVSCVALICLVLLAGLLFIMRKRQTRFNYGERCRPVSLDAFSLDSVSAYNSVRRKGANRASKRSYGNPTFEDSTAIPSHPLNFTGLSTFCNEQNTIYEEFSGIPQVSAKIDELPPGAEVKNRYANVIPLPETRVQLLKINNDPLSDYINASYVRGPKNATKYYIACQSPIESTVTDFWRMIWEQQSKVIIMLTDLIENGAEKCAEYIPPSEVTDCHRLYGDYQVTLKKRETKEKYAISTLHLKNLENNTYREISHIWYLWLINGVQTDAAGLIAVLLEARALQRGGPTPIVVHCSPGTGRTGTLIALDLAIRQYEITRTVDVPRVVYTIRRDRAGAVQTKEQYAFIYKALNLYATKLAGGGLEST